MENKLSLKQADLIAMLENCRRKTDGEEWIGMFAYPGCGWTLVQMGLANADTTITDAGRGALFLLGKGPDPFPNEGQPVTFSFAIPEKPDATPNES